MAESSLGEVLRPNKTHGRCSNQSEEARRACKEFFNCLWNLSTMPLDRGRKAVVVLCLILSREQMADHRDEVNWAPLSLVITAGTPNLEIHPWNMAEAKSAAAIPVRGTASGHLVDLSMHVKRYVKPLDEGKGPTRSTCTCANILKGTGIFSGQM